MLRSRLVLTMLVVVALAGLAAGLLVARGNSASVPSGTLASGQFQTVSWMTRGNASIVGRNGRAYLQLRGFQTQKAPELWIVFEGKTGVTSRRQITNLNRAWGNQNYAVSSEFATHPPARVLIYCAKCGRVWGYAQMRAASTSSF